VSDDAIRAEWLSSMATHLLYGLPAVILILAVLFLTLRRTQRLYEEADRREAAEIALRQSQRLEAIGQLTGGVAHDFNNLLMIVSGSVHRLRRDVIDEKQLRLLDAIVNAIRRGESLTRQLLSFSRRQTLQPTVIDLAAWLPELKEMLSRSLRGDIEVRLLVPRRPCFVKIDASELELALLNLAFNARDAMPSGGVLSITAKPITLRGKAGEEGLSGPFVAIRVADSGQGIPADILPRVFEPFFTTKEVGKEPGSGSLKSTALPSNPAAPPTSPARLAAVPRLHCFCRAALKRRRSPACFPKSPAPFCPAARCCWWKIMPTLSKWRAAILPISASTPRSRPALKKALRWSSKMTVSRSSSPTY
jgi:two-component system NtrC family sensor kinase